MFLLFHFFGQDQSQEFAWRLYQQDVKGFQAGPEGKWRVWLWFWYIKKKQQCPKKQKNDYDHFPN